LHLNGVDVFPLEFGGLVNYRDAMDQWAQLKAIIEDIEQRAYQRGWDDAVAHILKAAKSPSLRSVLPSAAIVPPHHSNQPMIDMVREIIRSHPGARGSEIVTEVQKVRPDQPRKSLDRTVRTALMRLKKRGAIESRGGVWYASEKEAA
jgi:hypothetical protein